MQTQMHLPLPFPEIPEGVPLLPVRMVNEYEYCPRLAYLEWVQGEWADSRDTVDGRFQHRRVDQKAQPLKPAEELLEDERMRARSVTLSSDRLGIIAKMDLVEADDGIVSPIEFKRGKRPHVEQGAYQPERIQVCAQGLILEEHGYQCSSGFIYFAESRERVRVVFDEVLRHQTLMAIHGLRSIAANAQIPVPLEDSPKCPRCSLVGICLPDEVNLLRGGHSPPRPLAAGAVSSLPLYIQANNAKISKKGENLEITVDKEKIASARIIDVSQISIMGNAYITAPALQEMMRREITVSWHYYGGWFMGHTAGIGHKNVELRTAQYKASFDEQVSHYLARGLVRAKILNTRTLLRRNWRGEGKPTDCLRRLRQFAGKANRTGNQGELLGYEGCAAAEYFRHFPNMIRTEGDGDFSFDFAGRNRRPPCDAVNAMLSFAYAMLARTWSVTLSAVGFDPFRGFYHQPRYGRPSLALDMMEPFRPLIADSAVLMAINNGEVRPQDFITAGGSTNLTPAGRKRFIATFERRMSQEVTHPLFGYRICYRRLLEVQARLLARFLMGELRDYPNFMTR